MRSASEPDTCPTFMMDSCRDASAKNRALSHGKGAQLPGVHVSMFFAYS
jgi:hypothetical protein